MADRSLTYVVKIDAASAQHQAAQLRAIFQDQLKNVDLSSASKSAQTADAQAVASAKAAAQERIQAAKAETAERTQAARAAANAEIEEEKRATAAFKAELQQRTQAAQQQARQPQQPVGGGQQPGATLGGLGNTLLAGAAGYFTVQGARQIAAQAEAFAQFGTQVRRTEASFKIMSGSASEAAARIASIKAAGGSAIDTLHAMEIANQAVSLHLASTAKEFGDLTRAGREVALVSPVIHDVQSAISELGLASANLSFRRLDQLGLSADEVKSKMRELQAANSGLDDSQAFLQASVQTLNAKYGDLLNTSEAAASGVEKLQVAVHDLWAEIAAGPAGKGVDNIFSGVAGAINEGLAYAGSKDAGVLSKALDDVLVKAKENAKDFENIPLLGSSAQGQLQGLSAVKKVWDEINAGVASGIPIAGEYQKQMDDIIISVIRKNSVTDEELQKLHELQTGYAAAAAAQRVQINANKQADQQAAARKTQQENLSKLLEPVTKLGGALKDDGLNNFFQQLHNGLAASAEMTATENNHLATMRQQLVDIGRAVADSGGAITESQRQQVTAINQQIEALSRAASLNEKLKTGDRGGGGQDLEAIYTRLNAIVAQTRGIFDETANAARALGDAIAQSGNASADQLAQIEQLAAQANQADFSRIAESLKELNSGSLDAIPGIDSLREKLASFYDILASGQGLTSAQAAEFAQLTAEAAALGGSTSALAGIQDQLGYSFLNSHEYVAALIQQIANLEALYAGGQIGADQFAGGMAYLTGELNSQIVAAGRLNPQLAQLLTLLNAVKAAASGGTFGPATPNGTFFGGFGGGGTVNTGSAGYLAGQAQAQAAAAAARAKADAGARAEAIKEQAKAAKQAAGATQNAFEDAAKGTQKAFEAVVDDMRSALQKVEGLFSPSKVTAEDMAAAKAGVYQPKADELLRQVKSAAENPADQARFAAQIAQAREALQKIGVAPAENLKAMAAQLEQAWSTSALFSNKDNLKLINADAVKFQLNLAAKAKEGQENIYEYFGATLDGVKEKFAAKDPTIVDAVAAELQGSQDKNLKALGKSLEDGINGAVEKTLKNLAAAEAGFAKGAGGGSGGGGGAVSVGAIPTSGGGGTWIDTVSKNVGNAYQNFANLYAPGPGATIPKTGNSTLFGPPAPGKTPGLDTTGLAPTELTGKVKITAVELDPALVKTFEDNLYNTFAAQTARSADIGRGIAQIIATSMSQADVSAQVATFTSALYGAFAGHTAPLASTGKGIAQVVGVSMSQADLSAPANAYMQALATAFGGATPAPKTLGEALDNAIQNGFIHAPRGGDMATGFVNALAASFGTYAPNYTAIGDTISYSIESAITNRPERLDMAGNFIVDLANQFGNADALTTYESTGSNISYIIESAIANRTDRLDMASSLLKDLATQLGQQDYSVPTNRFTNGLRTSFGADADQFNAIGQGVAQFIGLGITDYDLSGVGSTVIGNVSASFTGDSVRTQLQGVGSAISGAIFSGFQSSLAYQPWLSTLVQTVVSQAMESMTNSINDSLQVQAVGL